MRGKVLALGLVLVLAMAAPALAAGIPDFTFVHISDQHFARKDTEQTVADLAALREIELKPYGITAPAPSFVIDTGDLTEFGPKDGAWDQLCRAYAAVPFVHHMALGNHDQTWRPLSPELTRLRGSTYYSFDQFGCHFVVLNSAGMLDPRPMIGMQQVEWLKRDLESTDRETPVFVAFHHPLDAEYSSRYETDRLLDVLRPYNVALVLVGHGHQVKHQSYDGVDMVQGGSTWGPCPPGYQVVSVVGGVLRVAYKERGKPGADTAMLEKPICVDGSRYPEIRIITPRDRSTCCGDLDIRTAVDLPAEQVKSAAAELDGSRTVDMKRDDGGGYGATVRIADLARGAHRLRVVFTDRDGRIIHRSACFYVDTGEPRVLWRAFLGASSKSTPAIAGDSIIVGANDGFVRAYSRRAGRPRWSFATGGAAVGEPLVIGDRICVGSEDGQLYCLDAATGECRWSFKATAPVYRSPVTDGKSVYFGSADGAFYSIDSATGKPNWTVSAASYTIESKPFISDGRIYFGAWDTYVYCLNCSDGSLAWKCVGQGSAEGTAPAYYSPADCGPVLCASSVFAADRKYRLSIIDATSGELIRFLDKVSAVGPSSDGRHAYLRRTDGRLIKIDSRGRTVWSADASLDDVPAVPREVGGVVYVCSKRGLASAFSASDGRLIWQYQATPSSYVLAEVAASDTTAYVVGTDGSLTALATSR